MTQTFYRTPELSNVRHKVTRTAACCGARIERWLSQTFQR